MFRFGRRSALPIALVTLSALVPVADASQTGAPVRVQLQDFVRRAEKVGFSGTMLVARAGRYAYVFAAGWADRDRRIRVRPETAFDVGSLTKQFTAAAILRLEMAGRLSVSDSLGRFFPDAPADELGITIDQLLTHSSGLADDYWGQHRSLGEDQYLALMLQGKLLSVPGRSFEYSNVNYHLLKRIVEKTSGTSYEQFLRQEVFTPAGMRNTGYRVPTWTDGQVAKYQDWTTRDWIRAGIPVALNRPAYRGSEWEPHPEGAANTQRAALLSAVADAGAARTVTIADDDGRIQILGFPHRRGGNAARPP